MYFLKKLQASIERRLTNTIEGILWKSGINQVCLAIMEEDGSEVHTMCCTRMVLDKGMLHNYREVNLTVRKRMVVRCMYWQGPNGNWIPQPFNDGLVNMLSGDSISIPPGGFILGIQSLKGAEVESNVN